MEYSLDMCRMAMSLNIPSGYQTWRAGISTLFNLMTFLLKAAFLVDFRHV